MTHHILYRLRTRDSEPRAYVSMSQPTGQAKPHPIFVFNQRDASCWSSEDAAFAELAHIKFVDGSPREVLEAERHEFDLPA